MLTSVQTWTFRGPTPASSGPALSDGDPRDSEPDRGLAQRHVAGDIMHKRLFAAGRHTARIEGGFAVLLIGMRINKPRKVHRWWPRFTGIPMMIRELSLDPRSGLLGVKMRLLGGVPTVIQFCPLI